MGQVSSVGVSQVREALSMSDRLWSFPPVGREWRRWFPVGVSALFPVILRCLCATAAGLGQETKPAVSGSVYFTGSVSLNRSLGSSHKVHVTALGKEQRW